MHVHECTMLKYLIVIYTYMLSCRNPASVRDYVTHEKDPGGGGRLQCKNARMSVLGV